MRALLPVVGGRLNNPAGPLAGSIDDSISMVNRECVEHRRTTDTASEPKISFSAVFFQNCQGDQEEKKTLA